MIVLEAVALLWWVGVPAGAAVFCHARWHGDAIVARAAQ